MTAHNPELSELLHCSSGRAHLQAENTSTHCVQDISGCVNIDILWYKYVHAHETKQRHR